MKEKTFSAMAVTAPHWIRLPKIKQSSLNGSDPFSLQNAIRLAVSRAKKEDFSPWTFSNWNTKDGVEESVFLYQYFENQKDAFLQKLVNVNPDFLIISCMTLGYRGAVEIASLARKTLNKELLIIIGGKHIIETTFLNENGINENIDSPLSQIKNNVIEPVFDLVISGDGEEIIADIGELIYHTSVPFKKSVFLYELPKVIKSKGDWLIGYVDKAEIKYIKSKNIPLNQDLLPFPIDIFEPKSNFPVFNSDRTIHTYSYMSKGCPYDCFFCSEKRSINGKPLQVDTAALRLTNQFESVKSFGKKNNLAVSAFVEDSILLGGNLSALNELATLLKNKKLFVNFGAQYTIDLLLNSKHQEVLKKLKEQGLSYLFIGVETNVEDIAVSMSKNSNKKTTWKEKTEQVITFLRSLGIKCGFSILFGLGEKFQDRLLMLEQIGVWQKKYNLPNVVSLNLATKHPLRDNGKIDFLKWGTDNNSKYLPIFTEIFGEASYEYCIDKSYIGTIKELGQIKKAYEKIKKEQ